MFDFKDYYISSRYIIAGNSLLSNQITNSFVPFFSFIFYIPFSLLPFKIAEFAITFLNLCAYWFTFYFYWKNTIGKIKPFFWFFIALIGLSYPIILSLVAGNPLGIVTFGIYAFFIFRKRSFFLISFLLSVVLKLFPAFLCIYFFLLIVKQNKYKNILKYFKKAIIPFIFLFGLLIIILPLKFWFPYITNYAIRLFSFINRPADLSIYTQSFVSSLGRWGINTKFFSFLFLIFFLSIILSVVIIFRTLLRKKIKNQEFLQDTFFGILLCATLLLNPLAWQYYFVVLFPFLMKKIYYNGWKYVLVFLALSIDGSRFSQYGFYFLYNNQFLGTFILFLLLINEFTKLLPKFLSFRFQDD